MKKIKLIVISMLLLTCSFILMGFDSSQQKIYDDAGILTSSEESELQQLCVETAQSIEIDVIIVTTNDNKGKSAMTYAKEFFDSHNFGYDTTQGDAVLFLIDMDGRESYIATSGSGITYLSDARIDNIINATTTYLKKNDYNRACEIFVNKINGLTISEKLLDHIGIKILIAVGLGVVVVIIMMYNAKAKMTVGSQTYVKDHKFDIRDTRDIFINTTVVKHKIPTNNSKGGGGSFHTGSGGHTFGGGGGKF